MLSPTALSRPNPTAENPFPTSHGGETVEAPPPPPPPPTSSGESAPSTIPSVSSLVNLTEAQPPPQTPSNPRKRRASRSPQLDTRPPVTPRAQDSSSSVSISALLTDDSGGRKRGRTNTPWTAAEEQRLKVMRDDGKSWSEIAKAFPARTEGSVKKHWYKDMHYAEFAQDEEVALLEAIKEYDANKWKVIGQKLGKPAKACEQYAKEHFKNY